MQNICLVFFGPDSTGSDTSNSCNVQAPHEIKFVCLVSTMTGKFLEQGGGRAIKLGKWTSVLTLVALLTVGSVLDLDLKIIVFLVDFRTLGLTGVTIS